MIAKIRQIGPARQPLWPSSQTRQVSEFIEAKLLQFYRFERSTDRQFPPRRALHRPKLARIGHRNLLANCELAHPVHPKARATRSPKWRSRCVYQPTFERRSAGGQSCAAALKPWWPPSGWFSMCSESRSPCPHRSYRAQ